MVISFFVCCSGAFAARVSAGVRQKLLILLLLSSTGLILQYSQDFLFVSVEHERSIELLFRFAERIHALRISWNSSEPPKHLFNIFGKLKGAEVAAAPV